MQNLKNQREKVKAIWPSTGLTWAGVTGPR